MLLTGRQTDKPSSKYTTFLAEIMTNSIAIFSNMQARELFVIKISALLFNFTVTIFKILI